MVKQAVEKTPMKLTLDALEVLDAIDKKGSFAAAAAMLHRVPSTITYTMQKLEEDLGFIIFRREGRRSVLTPAGNVLLEQGRDLLIAAEQMIEIAHQANNGWESSLSIALDTTWDVTSFYPIVARFHQLNTGVEINLFEEVMGGSLEALIENRADIVVGGPLPAMPIKGFKFEKLFEINWRFVVARNHPLTKITRPLNEADIEVYPSVIIKDSAKTSTIKNHRVFDKQTKLRVPTIHHKILAIIQGVGVGFLPEHKIQPQIESGEMVCMTLENEAQTSIQYCSWKTTNKGKAMRWFLDKILSTSDREPI